MACSRRIVGVDDVAAGLEVRSPNCRIGLGKGRHAFEVIHVAVVAMPIYDVAEGAATRPNDEQSLC